MVQLRRQSIKERSACIYGRTWQNMAGRIQQNMAGKIWQKYYGWQNTAEYGKNTATLQV